jgi:tRNA-specific 2-thiouridylase
VKTAVLLSGGVDSSVALASLKAEGTHELTAFYLKIWLEDELAFLGDCPWEDDLHYVRSVCEQFDVPLRIIPLQTEYFQIVVEYAIGELKAGRTPSPDILCNQHIKFGAFYDRIDDSFDKVATGHYARIEEIDGTMFLKRAPDPVKDQTYFLARLSQQQLRRALFPIGHLQKERVRQLAQEYELPNMTRPDSQGICFLGKIKYPEFVRFHLGDNPGDIVDLETGNVLGSHRGIWFHTIGQRHGLGLAGGPWYVVRKDCQENIIYVAHATASMAEARNTLTVGDVHWISGKPDGNVFDFKLRHGPKLVSGTAELLPDDRAEITLSVTDPGVAAGQSAIFYHGDTCLGIGTIE